MAAQTKSEQWLLVRSTRDISDALKSLLNILSFNEIPKTISSDKVLKSKFPGDVNFFETVTINAPREDALNYITIMLTNIIQQIQAQHRRTGDLFFRELRIGVDSRYDYPITETMSRDELINIAIALSTAGLLDQNAYKELTDCITDWRKFRDKLRWHRVIRWTPAEIIHGSKILQLNKPISLHDALAIENIIQLELISLAEVRMRHIDVYYNFQCIENGTIVPLHRITEPLEELFREMIKYNTPPMENPIFLMRTFWNYSRILDNQPVIEKLNENLPQDLIVINQIYNDILLLNDLYCSVLQGNQDEHPEHHHRRIQKIEEVIIVEILDMQKRVMISLSPNDVSEFFGAIVQLPAFRVLTGGWLGNQSSAGQGSVDGLSLRDAINTIIVAIYHYSWQVLNKKHEPFARVVNQILTKENRKGYRFSIAST
jgi:hypothetical protein